MHRILESDYPKSGVQDTRLQYILDSVIYFSILSVLPVQDMSLESD